MFSSCIICIHSSIYQLINWCVHLSYQYLSIHYQAIKQPIHPSTNQSIHQSTNPSTNQPIHPPINQSIITEHFDPSIQSIHLPLIHLHKFHQLTCPFILIIHPTYIQIHPLKYPSAYPSIHPPTHPSIHSNNHQSTYPTIQPTQQPHLPASINLMDHRLIGLFPCLFVFCCYNNTYHPPRPFINTPIHRFIHPSTYKAIHSDIYPSIQPANQTSQFNHLQALHKSSIMDYLVLCVLPCLFVFRWYNTDHMTFITHMSCHSDPDTLMSCHSDPDIMMSWAHILPWYVGHSSEYHWIPWIPGRIQYSGHLVYCLQ